MQTNKIPSEIAAKRIRGIWELKGPAAQLVLDIQADAVNNNKAKPGKNRVIQKLLCELYNERNKGCAEC